ncbi:hypothetical protein CCR94_08140 [Rhodoblastus sphagnicola]|uniref:Uncharacterized protein n=1 Tax=Rhodoblastus sphagnicola TaxID=333368 RepID=A0A2S6NAW9_9HYPH|nr:hypothetical protein [Rhodoblastus sphagnicola]PPQ31756.1 hypothetical protein CCR94_08140 [Rhodoblastus sphagnicola]
MFSVRADAADEADRLREALRGSIAQARQLEDQRAALQAKIANYELNAERDKAAAKAQVDAAKAESKAAKAEVREVRQQQRDAVEEFNKRLAERDETLEKWKTAYEEAANVARSKDAERAKFEGQANAFKASAKSCQSKNALMLKASQDLLKGYRDLALPGQEPLLGLSKVEVENYIQETNDRLLDQKAVQ